MQEEYRFVEFRNKYKFLERSGFFDISDCNKAIYKAQWTGLHDLGLMYGMQAFGLMKVELI